MANNIAAGVPELWSAALQENLYVENIAFSSGFAEHKFEDMLSSGDTVHWNIVGKQSVSALASSYSNVTITPIVLTDETLIIDTRLHNAFELSNEDIKQMVNNPLGETLRSVQEAYSEEMDKDAFGEYTNATYVIDDGDMDTATNGGVGNAIIPTKANIYEVFVKIEQKMNENNIPMSARKVVVSPAVKALLTRSPEFIAASNLGDSVKVSGMIGQILDMAIFVSNNLTTASSTTHCLAYNGSPVKHATQIRPDVEYTPSSAREKFVGLWKSQLLYGQKMFTEGANRTLDVQLEL